MKKIMILFITMMLSISTAAFADTDPATAISNGMSETELLDTLVSEGMSLQDAVNAIIAAGGNQQNTLTAAMVINPEFQYTPPSDPTAGLNPTAAGPDTDPNAGLNPTGAGGTRTIAFTGGSGGGGGGGTVSP